MSSRREDGKHEQNTLTDMWMGIRKADDKYGSNILMNVWMGSRRGEDNHNRKESMKEIHECINELVEE